MLLKLFLLKLSKISIIKQRKLRCFCLILAKYPHKIFGVGVNYSKNIFSPYFRLIYLFLLNSFFKVVFNKIIRRFNCFSGASLVVKSIVGVLEATKVTVGSSPPASRYFSGTIFGWTEPIFSARAKTKLIFSLWPEILFSPATQSPRFSMSGKPPGIFSSEKLSRIMVPSALSQ